MKKSSVISYIPEYTPEKERMKKALQIILNKMQEEQKEKRISNAKEG